MWVQDGGFGNVIGSPSRNAPTSFGNTRSHTLPYSDIWFMLSYNKWLRPDVNADPDAVVPDILVDPAYALDVALAYLATASIIESGDNFRVIQLSEIRQGI